MLGNETAKDLTDALNGFKADRLIEALNRHTAAMQNLTTAVNRLIRALPAQPAGEEPDPIPVPEWKSDEERSLEQFRVRPEEQV